MSHDDRQPPADGAGEDTAALEQQLAQLDAAGRVRFVLDRLATRPVLSSSFGAQAAVALHLVTRELPDIPVLLIDTGYLFPETYRFVDQLADRLRLNLKVCRAEPGPAWFEARHGRLWEHGREGIARYNELRKLQPMRDMLEQLGADAWFAGVRRQQSRGRAATPFISRRGGRWKVHPIADWTDRDIGAYLARHRLPYHPLWHAGYVSVGDVHTTVPLHAASDAESTRFLGLQRECGLHTHL